MNGVKRINNQNRFAIAVSFTQQYQMMNSLYMWITFALNDENQFK